MDDLRNRSISAVLWGAGGTVLRILIQIVSQIVLARILGPEQYGLFATGLIVVFFTTFVADGGLAYGLVQRPEVTDDDIRFVFTWQMLAAAAFAAGLFLGAPLIARLFGDARLVTVMHWLSLSPLITAFGATASALLRRRLDFRVLNVAAVVSYAVAFLVLGIPLALMGYEVLSLIVSFLAQGLIAALMSFAAARHPIAPLLRHPGARGIVGFGLTVLFTNVVNWLLTNLDRTIVGATMGATATGLYATVQNLINVPATSALAMLQPVFYAASAKVQGHQGHLRHGLRAMLGAVGLFIVPVFVAIAVVAETFILAVYGHKWAGGETVLAPFALAVPFMLLAGLATPVLWTAGYPQREAQLQVPILLVWGAVAALLARLGSLEVMAWAVTGLFAIRTVVIVGVTMQAVAMKATEVTALLAPGVALSALVAVAALIADRTLGWLGLAPLLRLLLDIAACAVAMLGGLIWLQPLIGAEVRELFAKLGTRLPAGPARQVLNRLLPT